jgi:hypothetical protein
MNHRVVLINKKKNRVSTRKKHMWMDYEKRDVNPSVLRYEHPSIRANRRGKTGKKLIIKIKGKI